MDAALFGEGDLTHVLQITDAVDVLEKAVLSIVATLDDVLRNGGKVDAGSARNGCILACDAYTQIRTALAS